MTSVLIKNGRVWDGERFFFADVLTEGHRIAQIAPGITGPADFEYDATGKTVSPGLVDAHMHIRGISREGFSAQGEASCFPFGVTAAADAGGMLGDKSLLDSFMLKTVVFAEAEIRDNHADFSRTREMLAKYGDRALGIKIYLDTASPEVRDATPLREACAWARERGLRLMVHCTNSPISMAELLSHLAPRDILTHAFHGGPNSAAADGFASLRQAQSRGVIIDAGFAGHIHTDFHVLRQAMEAGMLPDSVSTDLTTRSVFTRGGRYGLTMCMNMALVAGMEEEALFRSVTSGPAAVLGKEKEWGALQVGRTADIAVLEQREEPFSLTDAAGNCLSGQSCYRCVLTVSDGIVVFRD